MNRHCPRCGSYRVQLAAVESNHGCLWLFLFGWAYVFWVVIKWCIGFLLLVYLDWWMAIIKNAMGKGYVWKCKRWFTGRRRHYYCHDCFYNFVD